MNLISCFILSIISITAAKHVKNDNPDNPDNSTISTSTSMREAAAGPPLSKRWEMMTEDAFDVYPYDEDETIKSDEAKKEALRQAPFCLRPWTRQNPYWMIPIIECLYCGT